MEKQNFRPNYLPEFDDDLFNAATYISEILKNRTAALRLVNDVYKAIHKRLDAPLSFEPYHSAKPRKDDYYRIYVRNYIVLYVVKGNVMEVRRFIYGGRNLDDII